MNSRTENIQLVSEQVQNLTNLCCMVVFLNCVCFLCTVLLHLRALASARPQRTDSLIDRLIHYRICPSLPDQCTVTRSYLFLHKFWFFSTIYYFGNWAFIAVSQSKDVANKRASPLKFHCWTFSARRQTTAWYFFIKCVFYDIIVTEIESLKHSAKCRKAAWEEFLQEQVWAFLHWIHFHWFDPVSSTSCFLLPFKPFPHLFKWR